MKKILFLTLLVALLNQSYAQTKTINSKTNVTVKKNVKPVVNTPIILTLKEAQIKHLTETACLFLKYQFMGIDYNLMLYKKPLLEFLNHTDTSVIILQKDYLNHTKYKMVVSLDSMKIRKIDMFDMSKRFYDKTLKNHLVMIYKFEYNTNKQISNMVCIYNGEISNDGSYSNGKLYYSANKLDSILVGGGNTPCSSINSLPNFNFSKFFK